MSLKREQLRGMLAQYCLTYVWLCSQLNKRGVNITPHELCLYVTGRRQGPKAHEIIRVSLDIVNCYVVLYENAVSKTEGENNDDSQDS